MHGSRLRGRAVTREVRRARHYAPQPLSTSSSAAVSLTKTSLLLTRLWATSSSSTTGSLTRLPVLRAVKLDVAQPRTRLLPPVLHVPADPVGGRDIGAREAGSRVAAARLIDLLLVAAIRRWAEQQPVDGAPSWLTALRDPMIGRVLALLHDRPGDSWTVASLAKEVHVSRATLARRFTDPSASRRSHISAIGGCTSLPNGSSTARRPSGKSRARSATPPSMRSTARSHDTAASRPDATAGSPEPLETTGHLPATRRP
jgi:hypothetical protein